MKFHQLDWLVQKISRATGNLAIISGDNVLVFKLACALGARKDLIYWCPQVGDSVPNYLFETIIVCESFDADIPSNIEWFNKEVMPRRSPKGTVSIMPYDALR